MCPETAFGSTSGEREFLQIMIVSLVSHLGGSKNTLRSRRGGVVGDQHGMYWPQIMQVRSKSLSSEGLGKSNASKLGKRESKHLYVSWYDYSGDPYD
jgi:hypothetical protein